MTLMFCSFEKHPLILRVYGTARLVYPGQQGWQSLIDQYPNQCGARQIFEMNIDMVQTSCGYAVPYYEYLGERETLKTWSQNKTPQELQDYWQEKNTSSIDGKPTGL